MIDLILFGAVCTVFYLGFWCGNRYTSIRKMLIAGLDYLKSL